MPAAPTDSPLHPHEPEIPPTLDDEGRCRVCLLLVEVEGLRAALEQIASGTRDDTVALTEPLFRLTRRRMMRVAEDALEGST